MTFTLMLLKKKNDILWIMNRYKEQNKKEDLSPFLKDDSSLFVNSSVSCHWVEEESWAQVSVKSPH